MSSTALFSFRPSASGVYGVAAHCDWSVNTVKFIIQPAGIADHLTLRVASPDCSGHGTTVAACQVHAASCQLYAKQYKLNSK
jgi:hypothetical protein